MIRLKPENIHTAYDVIKLLVKSGIRNCLKGDKIEKFLDSARRGSDNLSRFLRTVSVISGISLGFILDPITLISNLLCFLGMLYNKAHEYSQVKSEEEF